MHQLVHRHPADAAADGLDDRRARGALRCEVQRREGDEIEIHGARSAHEPHRQRFAGVRQRAIPPRWQRSQHRDTPERIAALGDRQRQLRECATDLRARDLFDRGAFLAGRYGTVFEQIVAIKQSCGDARLKVILETGELATYDNVRRASWLGLLAGADFIKTSTGKISPAATLPVVHVMLQAVKDWKAETGTQRAVKPAGGIRTAKDAIRYLVAVHEVAGPEWLDPYYFRFGASSVLNDLIMQRRAQLDGHYSGADYVTVD